MENIIPQEPMQSVEIGELAMALAQAQGEIKGAAKDSSNPFFKASYADLASVWEACRAALSKNKIAIIQRPITINDTLYLDTIMAHPSNQWICGRAPIKPVKDDPQGIGSAITYMRRYSLAAMVGVAPEDDDGENAMGRGKEQEPKPASPKPSVAPRMPADPAKEARREKLKSWALPMRFGPENTPDYDTWTEVFMAMLVTVDSEDTLLLFKTANSRALKDLEKHNPALYEELKERCFDREMVIANGRV